MSELLPDDKRVRVLLSLYQLHTTKSPHVDVDSLEELADVGNDFYEILRYLGASGKGWLKKTNLVVRITAGGIEKAEEIIKMRMAEKIRLVQGKIYDMGGSSHIQPVNFELLKSELGMEHRELVTIILELDRRGWTGRCSDECVCLSPLGVHEYESPSDSKRGGDTFNNTFNAPVQGGFQQGGSHNTQNNVYSNNPKIDEAADAIIRIIQSSGITELDKEDLIKDVARLKELGAKEKTPDVIERSTKKLEALKTGLEVAEKGGGLLLKASPYLTTLWQLLTTLNS